MKKFKLIIVNLVLFGSVAQAQLNKVVDYSGLYRMNGQYNHIGGNAFAGDTVSERRSSNAYVLFDLGLNVNPFKELKVSAILRSRSNIGASYSQQLGPNILQFRQVRVEGNFAKVIKYQLGDIDVSLTKYTIFNSNESFNEYEAEAFAMRRNIVSYENFNVGNNWRMQGGQFETNLLFRKYIERVKAKAILTRVKKSNITTIPDRYVLAGNLNVVQGKYLEIGGNYVRMFDNVGTAVDTTYNYANSLLTGNYKLKLDVGNLQYALYGEGGPSFFKYTEKSTKKEEKFNDYFYDLGISSTYKPGKIKVYGEYRNVGPLFTSPTAQTLRLYPYSGGAEVKMFSNGLNRLAGIYDRLTNEGMYNQSIYVGLMSYLPIYGNVTPYGQATPNRKGFTVGIDRADSSNILNVHAKAQVLTEVMGEGTESLRNFTALEAGTKLGLTELLKLKKNLALTVGFASEKTERDGAAPINFKTTSIDAGLTIETLKKLELMFGVKYVAGKGNELLANRNLYNTIQSFTDYKIDLKQNIVSVGARYKIFKDSYIGLTYNQYNNMYALDDSFSYQWKQIWGNLTIKF
ncbi:MAG: hypothetical protein U0V72_15940 [Cytophagales bacterium]